MTSSVKSTIREAIAEHVDMRPKNIHNTKIQFYLRPDFYTFISYRTRYSGHQRIQLSDIQNEKKVAALHKMNTKLQDCLSTVDLPLSCSPTMVDAIPEEQEFKITLHFHIPPVLQETILSITNSLLTSEIQTTNKGTVEKIKVNYAKQSPNVMHITVHTTDEEFYLDPPTVPSTPIIETKQRSPNLYMVKYGVQQQQNRSTLVRTLDRSIVNAVLERFYFPNERIEFEGKMIDFDKSTSSGYFLGQLVCHY